jgi:hypothetical protein
MADAIIQASHACLELGLSLPDNKKPTTTSHIILLPCKNEEKLLNIHDLLDEKGIAHSLFFEPDDNMGYTAIATEPQYNGNRNFFKKFQLWEN